MRLGRLSDMLGLYMAPPARPQVLDLQQVLGRKVLVLQIPGSGRFTSPGQSYCADCADSHLSSCDRDQELVARTESMRTRLEQMEQPNPPADFFMTVSF